MQFNKTLLVGNFTRDPDIKYLSDGQMVVNFSLACNERGKDKEGNKTNIVSFFECAAFGKVAEIIGDHLGKGDMVLIEGKLKQDRWEDGAGNKRSKIKIIVNNVEFLKSKKDPQSKQPEDPQSEPNNDEFSDENPPF